MFVKCYIYLYIQALKKPVNLCVVWKDLIEEKNERKYVMIKGLCGGKRFITYEDLNLVTVDNIKEKAIQLFFPDGISH